MALQIITESSCDIPQKEAQEKGIKVLPLIVTFGNEEYQDGVTLNAEEFFKKLESSNDFPHTSQLTPEKYREIFKEVVENGDEAICISLSGKLSGSCSSAQLAQEEFKDKITVIDSNNVSIGQHILIDLAVELRDQGLDRETIAEILEEKKKDIKVLALLDTLEYLKKGGRISSAVAFIGGALSIKPVIAVEDGAVELVGKARGSKKGNNLIRKLVDKEGIDFDLPYTLGYSGLSDELLQKYIKDNKDLFEGKTDYLPKVSIGSTIGTHVGPGAIAVAFFKESKEN